MTRIVSSFEYGTERCGLVFQSELPFQQRVQFLL